jgi:UrcA family protein
MNTSIKINMAAFASALVASAMLLGGASAAEIPSKSKQLTFVDLDLATPAGVNAARERVHQAARELCAAVSDHLDLSHTANFLTCVDLAMSGAMPHLDALISKSNTSGMVASNRKD